MPTTYSDWQKYKVMRRIEDLYASKTYSMLPELILQDYEISDVAPEVYEAARIAADAQTEAWSADDGMSRALNKLRRVIERG